jgi:hypothetical protein
MWRGGRKAKVGSRGEVRDSCRTRQDAKARLEKKFGGVVTNPDPGPGRFRSGPRSVKAGQVRGAW